MNRKRLLVCVDTQNLWFSCHEELGENKKIDYRKLLKIAESGRDFAKVEAKAYMPVMEIEKSQTFISTLEYLGYKVKISQITGKEGMLVGTDMDVELVVDVVRKMDTFDTFVLVSGDSDFAPLLEFLNEKGKTVEVISFKSGFSEKLRPFCMSVRFLDIESVYIKEEIIAEKKR
ncbi:unnamed protein product [marine sediment metagenome]|uniref:NYN domain-containing protein n=1 Tax=marine sediment metagenome TaxID=412755 RepID=X1HJ13_9ZZZZ